MNISKNFEKFQKGIVIAAGITTLACAGFNSCSKKHSYKPQLEQTDSINTKKPNIPLIGKDSIYYRGLDGKVKNVANSEEIASLYNAISKMSTNENPNIANSEDFYIEVQKNIQGEKEEKNVWVQPRIEKNIFKARISEYFDNIFKLFTRPESEEGSVITVREYTKMMDAFSDIKPYGKDTP